MILLLFPFVSPPYPPRFFFLLGVCVSNNGWANKGSKLQLTIFYLCYYLHGAYSMPVLCNDPSLSREGWHVFFLIYYSGILNLAHFHPSCYPLNSFFLSLFVFVSPWTVCSEWYPLYADSTLGWRRLWCGSLSGAQSIPECRHIIVRLRLVRLWTHFCSKG